MFRVDAMIEEYSANIAQEMAKANFKNLGHAAAGVRKDAVASIIPADGPSPPGRPPHTRARVTKKGKHLKGELQRAIVFVVDKAREESLIGPRASVVGESAMAHEFGVVYKGQNYPRRPFMGPALEGAASRIAGQWAYSIGR